MKIFKNNQLFIISLVLVIAFCFSIATVGAQNNSQTDVNRWQVNVNTE